MKLKNKISGEIKEFILFDGNGLQGGATLESLTKEWEDAPEEPEKYCYMTSCGEVTHRGYRLWENESVYDKKRKEIGNYFETEEEAEKAMERLRAWKRLKDKGFEIESWMIDIGDNYYKTGQIILNLNNVRNREWDEYDQISEIKNDLDICFGGEE